MLVSRMSVPRYRWIITAAIAAFLVTVALLAWFYMTGRLPWPFALRYSDAAFTDPQFYPQLVVAFSAVTGGVLLAALAIVAGVLVQRRGWCIAAVGLICGSAL